MKLTASSGIRTVVLLGLCGTLQGLPARADDAAPATAPAPAPAVPASALQRCAAISAPGERLACYDQLAGRPTQAVTLATASPTPVVPVIPPEKAFGLTVAQRGPAPSDQLESISAKVALFGQSKDARPTIALDNGQVWELDNADPLLAVGDEVTIRRGALGSFMLRTAQQRTHRARRLR